MEKVKELEKEIEGLENKKNKLEEKINTIQISDAIFRTLLNGGVLHVGLRSYGILLELNEEDNKNLEEHCDIIRNSIEKIYELFDRNYLKSEGFRLAWERLNDS